MNDELLRAICPHDAEYTILVDKDGAAAGFGLTDKRKEEQQRAIRRLSRRDSE